MDNIEVVDYVWSGERYADLTGKQEYYDWVIASHVIEHVPDLVSFLQGCAEILADDGVLALVVPDFRNCFDHLRVPTSLAKVLDAYHNKNTRPTSGDVLEANLNASTKAGKITWSSKNKGKCEFVLEDGAAKELYARSLSSSDYIDVHTWCFTPNSFRLLIHDLAMLELIPFQVVDVVRTRSFEFYVPLKKTRVLQSVDRMALLEACQQDLYEPGVNGKNLLKKWFSRAR